MPAGEFASSDEGGSRSHTRLPKGRPVYLSCDDNGGRLLGWFVDEPLDLPTPPGLEWMTPDELDGYYLLYEPDAEDP